MTQGRGPFAAHPAGAAMRPDFGGWMTAAKSSFHAVGHAQVIGM